MEVYSVGSQSCLRVRTHQQTRVESNPVQSDSRVKGCSHRPSRVQSSLRESQWVSVLFEQRTSKDLYSDGDHACFACDYVEKEVAS